MTDKKEKTKIKVYSTPACPFCVNLKKYLKDHDLDFEVINVAEDKKAAKEMIEKSGQMGVPVLEANGKIVVGFDKKKINKILNIE